MGRGASGALREGEATQHEVQPGLTDAICERQGATGDPVKSGGNNPETPPYFYGSYEVIV